jgi:DNA repair exonuclease SbcCD ATPase subunit
MNYLKRNWITVLGVSTSAALSVYNWWETSSLKQEWEISKIAWQELKKHENTSAQQQSDEIDKLLQKLNETADQLSDHKTKMEAIEKKIKSLSRLRNKFANLEKSVVMSLESCGNQITGLSDQLSAMEGVYRQSLDSLDDLTKDQQKAQERLEKQITSLEQQQNMILLLRGVKEQGFLDNDPDDETLSVSSTQ